MSVEEAIKKMSRKKLEAEHKKLVLQHLETVAENLEHGIELRGVTLVKEQLEGQLAIVADLLHKMVTFFEKVDPGTTSEQKAITEQILTETKGVISALKETPDGN